jgi:tetratricopeptide (TPR) repeat protein
MDTDNEYWKTDYIEACNHYNSKEYEKALPKINRVLDFDKNNVSARNLKACILIELWNGDPKTNKSIYEAIDHLKVISEKDPENKKIYLMDLGNAYYQLAEYKLREEGKLNPAIIENLETAKMYFQESLSICEDQPAVWINQSCAGAPRCKQRGMFAPPLQIPLRKQ